MVGVMAGALSLAGCATQEAVEHAQATADQALGQANTATTAAQRAQSTADGAASAAAAAQADATKANTRLDTVESNLDHLMHHHEHGSWKNVGVKHGKFHRMPKAPDTTTPAPDAPK
jgi:outer membrane murein-binding lipoprotein Lpp